MKVLEGSVYTFPGQKLRLTTEMEYATFANFPLKVHLRQAIIYIYFLNVLLKNKEGKCFSVWVRFLKSQLGQ